MKTILKYFAVTATAFALSSCESFLDKAPQDFINPEAYMLTSSETFAVLTGIYDPLGREELWGNRLTLYAHTDDQLFNNRNYTTSQLDYNSPTSADGSIQNIWKWLYTGIARANQFLVQIDKPNMDEKTRLQYKGEALFLRAFYYFSLVQKFGNVPMRLIPIEDINKVGVAATPAPEVLKQVVKDMIEAEAIVGKASDKSLIGARITQSCVQGVLARVYLHMAGVQYQAGTDPFKLNTPAFDKKEMYEQALAWAYKAKASGLHKLNGKTVTFQYDNYSATRGLGGFEYMEVFQRIVGDEFDKDDKPETIWEAVGAGNRGVATNQEATYLSSQVGASFQWTTEAIMKHPAWFSYCMFSPTSALWDLFQDETLNPRDEGVIDLRRNTSFLPYSYVNLLYKGVSPEPAPQTLADIAVKPFLEPGVALPVGDTKYQVHSITNRPVGKYNREFDTKNPHDKNRSSCNIPLLRYSDILLMIAEAAYQVQVLGGTPPSGMGSFNQEIYDCVKEVRDRAKVNTPAMGSITLQFIKDERGRELCFEAIRRHDLIRWGELFTAYSSANANMQGHPGVTNGTHKASFATAANNVSTRTLLYPIPTAELSLNPLLKQNPGW